MKIETPETWAIRNKDTEEYFIAPSGKQTWKKPGHAKNAWSRIDDFCYNSQDKVLELCQKYNVKYIVRRQRFSKTEVYLQFPKFDEQDTWEVIKIISSLEERLNKAEDLLKQVRDGWYDLSAMEYIVNDIEHFIMEGKDESS